MDSRERSMRDVDFIERVNKWASARQPFFFLIDFEKSNPQIFTISQTQQLGIKFDLRGLQNFTMEAGKNGGIQLDPVLISRKTFAESFHNVKAHLKQGNSYLVNLTFGTPLAGDLHLEDIFHSARAPYRLYYPGQFVVFSPECFIRIEKGHIYSYPMKGTIDANIPDAKNELLNNKKEIYEHNTIVDLIRNDLAMISHGVEVIRFRYLQKVIANNRQLYQASSEIRGTMDASWRSNLGEMLFKILPAGSVSGAPKAKTLEIIREEEETPRGYYTGIFGYYDGENLDSAVSIRYIENTTKGMVYRSGGGITALSNEEDEFQEIINKIYVPIA